MEAIVVWHFYEEGKIVDYSITGFEGERNQLKDCLRRNAYGKGRNEEKKEKERRVILHQVVIL